MEMLTDLQHHCSHSRSINRLCKCLACEMGSSSHLTESGNLTNDYFRKQLQMKSLFVCALILAGGWGAYPTYSPVPDTMH